MNYCWYSTAPLTKQFFQTLQYFIEISQRPDKVLSPLSFDRGGSTLTKSYFTKYRKEPKIEPQSSDSSHHGHPMLRRQREMEKLNHHKGFQSFNYLPQVNILLIFTHFFSNRSQLIPWELLRRQKTKSKYKSHKSMVFCWQMFSHRAVWCCHVSVC